MIEEDKINEGLPVPFRFGKRFNVNLTLASGEWTDVEHGRLWSMEFQSDGAYSINFVFDNFYLSEGAQLYIANADGTMLYGPVTSKQNTKNGFFLTDLIQGDDVIIYLFEPDTEKGECELTIEGVIHAYRNLFPELYGDLGASLSCNNNIACYSSWDLESDAVALVLLSDGTEWCSGSLLMTADQSFRPYFLSAFHCIDISSPLGGLSTAEITNAENWMFKFQYKMTSCGGSTATTGITYNGAEFRAAWYNSDFALMEMDDSPVGDTRFSWLGWDRSGSPPTSGTGIHHPAGDVMKISFDNNDLTSNSSQINWSNGTTSPPNSHWVVGFDNGTTEGGSSGSPLFDQNGRVVGQLHGGQSGCAPVTKYYGQLFTSWTGGGTNTTRLSNWLDPCGSGVITTNTSRSPYLSALDCVCSSGNSVTIENLPSNSTVLWNDGSYITSSSSQGSNPCVFTATGEGESWIESSIISNCGDAINLRKDIWVGGLDEDKIVCSREGQAVGAYAEYHILCDEGSTPVVAAYDANNDSEHFGDASALSTQTILEYDWDVPSGWYWYSSGDNDEIEISPDWNTNPSLGDIVEIGVRVRNSCGWTSWKYNDWVVVSCSGMLSLSVSPNPTTSETILTIESISEEKALDEDAEWKYEVYSVQQLLMQKQTGIKGTSATIQTAGWKDGSYYIRVMYKGEVLLGKLVVKY